jgi:hypothetical protein
MRPVNKEYLKSFHNKNEDIDMNNKAIKNLSWSNDINDGLKDICFIMDCYWIIKFKVSMVRIKNCESVRPRKFTGRCNKKLC